VARRGGAGVGERAEVGRIGTVQMGTASAASAAASVRAALAATEPWSSWERSRMRVADPADEPDAEPDLAEPVLAPLIATNVREDATLAPAVPSMTPTESGAVR
jgi:hypothetical protein